MANNGRDGTSPFGAALPLLLLGLLIRTEPKYGCRKYICNDFTRFGIKAADTPKHYRHFSSSVRIVPETCSVISEQAFVTAANANAVQASADGTSAVRWRGSALDATLLLCVFCSNRSFI